MADRFVKITEDTGHVKKGEVYKTLSRDRSSVEIIVHGKYNRPERVWITDKHFEYTDDSSDAIDLHDELYPPTQQPTAPDEPETTEAKPTAKRKTAKK